MRWPDPMLGARDGRIILTGFVGHPSGRPSLRASLEGPIAEASALGRRLASTLLRDGAREILDEVRSDEIFP